MSKLLEKQQKFSQMVSQLIRYSNYLGYKVTLGEAYAYAEDKRHISSSNHYRRLAIDLNLFTDFNYITDTKDYQKLGEYWEMLGGSWGGRFGDGNHFSLEHNGVK